MSSSKKLSHSDRRHQAVCFLQYLQDRGLTKIARNKESVRSIFKEQFKIYWKKENGGAPLVNFAALFFVLKKIGFIHISKSGNIQYMPKAAKLESKDSQSHFVGSSSNNAENRNISAPECTKDQSTSPYIARKALNLKKQGPTGRGSVAVDQHVTSPDGYKSPLPDGASSAEPVSSPAASLPAGTKKCGRCFICEICEVTVTTKVELMNHLDGRKHRVQKLILGLKSNRDQLIQDQAGVEIKSDFDGQNGLVRVDLEENQDKKVIFTILNTHQTEALHFQHCELLRKIRIFKVRDQKRVSDGMGQCMIPPGGTYTVEVSCQPWHVGRFHAPLGFAFARLSSPDRLIHIVRYLSVNCKNQVTEELQPKTPYKHPPRKSVKQRGLRVVEGYALPRYDGDTMEREIPLASHSIPAGLRHIMNHGCKEWEDMSAEDNASLERLRKLLHDGLNYTNYHKYLSTLLHIEELQMEVDIRKYDMASATLTPCKDNPRLLVLKVPGLAENRPSVLKGDCLYVRPLTSEGSREEMEYKGYVHDVWQEEVHLGFHQSLLDKYIKNMKFAVRFTFNRLPLKLQQRATMLAEEHSLDKILFPKPSTICQYGQIVPLGTSLRFYNRDIETNNEQRSAIEHILAGTSRPAPYLVFGPPGTGKTVTMVEAMKQVLSCIPNSHILACAPSNSAADLLAQRLLQHRSKTEVLRINAASRPWGSVPDDIKESCNYDKSCRNYYFPKKETLLQYRVIVCTLVTAGRIASANFPPGHFTHIFMDEAGHAVEPEAVIAIAGILESDVSTKDGGQLVLAGDPEQLGPILRSPVAIQHRLGVSLLERYMKSCDVYSRRNNTEEPYDRRVVTKLLCNYRSHRAILELPNQIFYQNELKACADELKVSSLCCWSSLPQPGFPLMFHGVVGQDLREERSPSFFNPEEAFIVEKYVKELLTARGNGINIKQEHIGIITPYRKQVQKIQQRMTAQGWRDITVGSVEVFQGQERRVIIISTVRSNTDYLVMDKEFKLGFLANPKRFNVAITRAKALVIVIGNPNLLNKDTHWNQFLNYCCANHAYKGCDYDEPEDQLEDILQRFNAIQLGETALFTQEPGTESTVQQVEEPEWRGES